MPTTLVALEDLESAKKIITVLESRGLDKVHVADGAASPGHA